MTKYECGLAEGDVETGGICPFDDPNETIGRQWRDWYLGSPEKMEGNKDERKDENSRWNQVH